VIPGWFETAYLANIFAFVLLHLDLLAQPGRALGSWFDRLRNVRVLDVVLCLPDRRTAIELGRFFGQTSIYDLAAQREIAIRPRRIRMGFPRQAPDSSGDSRQHSNPLIHSPCSNAVEVLTG